MSRVLLCKMPALQFHNLPFWAKADAYTDPVSEFRWQAFPLPSQRMIGLLVMLGQQ